MTVASGTDDAPRRRSRLVVASVAAAALLVGGGGAYWASTAAGGAADDKAALADAAGDPPPLALDARGGTPGGPGIAPGEPDPSGSVYKASGTLPKGPDKAPVLRPQGKVTAAEVSELAKALGVSGTPRLSGGQWRIAPEKDGTGARLDVAVDAPGSWTFTRVGGTQRSDACLEGTKCAPPGAKRLPGGAPVSEAQAKAAAAPVLKALGQDDAKVRAGQVMGDERVVNADPVFGGLPTYGWATGLRVGPDGELAGGSGRLKEPVKSATYPVIGAEKALAALNEASRGTGPVDIGGCATDPPAASDGRKAKPEAPCQVTFERAPAQELTVTKAVLGLAAQFAGGREALVPSWLFEVAPKGTEATHTVVQTAVAPEFLTPKPKPAPTKPVPIPSDDAAPPQQLQSYAVDGAGRTLSATFWGGVCSDYGLTAAESAGRVTLTITETPRQPDRACIMMAVEITKSVTLKAPLGDRQVVDAASGALVPRQGPK
ncbi:hypothetical protein ACGFMM_29635 [Streptomyces sp. NPDC048604]|uniref:hypothetical protein n=1 Tax=Streptomyces sp. NPDC048604 TaxID=3365578 RepID=UPI00371F9103